MAEELLSLKWNNHQAHFMDILAFLREQEIFVDITLACGGKLYPAHKFVLSTCSEYFKQMFIKNPTKHPIVFMKDVSSKDLEALLDFMYNGEVNVPQSCLGSLIKTAEGLQIKGLAVPDDPPLPKETAREKRERELKHSLDRDRSPPPKRQKPRDKSPISSSKNSLRLSPSPRVGSDSSNKAQADANLDEDSRTSVHSGVSGHSEQSSQNPSLNVNSSNNQLNSDRPPSLNSSENVPRNSKDEPSPGPSGLHPHKEEQVEIKQEDVVDLGDEDEGGDWGSGMAGMGDPDGLGDSSLGSDQNPSFPDLMLPHGESSMSTNADPAMNLIQQGVSIRQVARQLCGSDRICPLCKRIFSHPESMIRHCNGHLPSSQHHHKCNNCGKAFYRRDQFKMHVIRCCLPDISQMALQMFQIPKP